jgi:hypothetical protein
VPVAFQVLTKTMQLRCVSRNLMVQASAGSRCERQAI